MLFLQYNNIGKYHINTNYCGRGCNPISTIFIHSKEILKRFALSKFGWFSLRGLRDMYIKLIRGQCLSRFLRIFKPPVPLTIATPCTKLQACISSWSLVSMVMVRFRTYQPSLGAKAHTYVPSFIKVSQFNKFIAYTDGKSSWLFIYTRVAIYISGLENKIKY